MYVVRQVWCEEERWALPVRGTMVTTGRAGPTRTRTKRGARVTQADRHTHTTKQQDAIYRLGKHSPAPQAPPTVNRAGGCWLLGLGPTLGSEHSGYSAPEGEASQIVSNTESDGYSSLSICIQCHACCILPGEPELRPRSSLHGLHEVGDRGRINGEQEWTSLVAHLC